MRVDEYVQTGSFSQQEDKWPVKLDVRDLGGHLETTFRDWSVTYAARVWLVSTRLLLVAVLPLDFHVRLRVGSFLGHYTVLRHLSCLKVVNADWVGFVITRLLLVSVAARY